MICGMIKPTNDILNMILSNDSHDDECNLANEKNAAFLQPQQEYSPFGKQID